MHQAGACPFCPWTWSFICLNHLLHLPEKLAQQAVIDILYPRARARRDAASAAGGVDDSGLFALLRGHRQNNGCHSMRIVNSPSSSCNVPQPFIRSRQHRKHLAPKSPILLHLAHTAPSRSFKSKRFSCKPVWPPPPLSSGADFAFRAAQSATAHRPYPSIRDAMLFRVERHPARRAFRPRPQTLIGLPVTARTESAAPPRVSPSSFGKHHAGRCPRISSNALATFTASWPAMAVHHQQNLGGAQPLRLCA